MTYAECMHRIYTRTGDKGETGLYSGPRLPKDHPLIEAIGTVDELNAAIGITRSFLYSTRIPSPPEERDEGEVEKDIVQFPRFRLRETGTLDDLLSDLQHILFSIGADLATVTDARDSSPRITEVDLHRLEFVVDSITAPLPELKNFILPAGGRVASHLHFARAVCRRAERAVAHLARHINAPSSHGGGGFVNPTILPYLNRLSTLLFVLARTAALAEGEEEIWNRLISTNGPDVKSEPLSTIILLRISSCLIYLKGLMKIAAQYFFGFFFIRSHRRRV